MGPPPHPQSLALPAEQLRYHHLLSPLPPGYTGRYAALLDYPKWLALNNAQRAHYNYVEGAPTALVELLLAGLWFPKFAASAGVVYIIGRQMYAHSYAKSGKSF